MDRSDLATINGVLLGTGLSWLINYVDSKSKAPVQLGCLVLGVGLYFYLNHHKWMDPPSGHSGH